MMARLDFDLLFRWFVGLGIDDPVWHRTLDAKNRDRLLEGAVAEHGLAAILAHPKVKPLLSREHFSVDGTLIGQPYSVAKGHQNRNGLIVDVRTTRAHGNAETLATRPSSPPSGRVFQRHAKRVKLDR
jgi:hypothetical protein